MRLASHVGPIFVKRVGSSGVAINTANKTVSLVTSPLISLKPWEILQVAPSTTRARSSSDAWIFSRGCDRPPVLWDSGGVRADMSLCFVVLQRAIFRRHLMITDTLSNIYSKADKVSKNDEEYFGHFAFLGAGVLVRARLSCLVRTTVMIPFTRPSPLARRELPGTRPASLPGVYVAYSQVSSPRWNRSSPVQSSKNTKRSSDDSFDLFQNYLLGILGHEKSGIPSQRFPQERRRYRTIPRSSSDW